MSRMQRSVELALAAVLLVCAVAFLINTPYLSVGVNSALIALFLAATYGYLRWRFSLRIPLMLFVLVFAALQVDALGNYFHLYTTERRPIRYDEFAHLIVQTLIMPVVVWLVRTWFGRIDARLPMGFASFFAVTAMFSLSAFYEVVELWDEVYFGGRRIWSLHDSAGDLQWDLCGILLGVVLAHVIVDKPAMPVR